MTEDGRSAVRRLFLLESVYKGGRRLAMALAKHPFEPVLQIGRVEFAQDASDKIAVRHRRMRSPGSLRPTEAVASDRQ